MFCWYKADLRLKLPQLGGNVGIFYGILVELPALLLDFNDNHVFFSDGE